MAEPLAWPSFRAESALRCINTRSIAASRYLNHTMGNVNGMVAVQVDHTVAGDLRTWIDAEDSYHLIYLRKYGVRDVRIGIDFLYVIKVFQHVQQPDHGFRGR